MRAGPSGAVATDGCRVGGLTVLLLLRRGIDRTRTWASRLSFVPIRRLLTQQCDSGVIVDFRRWQMPRTRRDRI